MPQQWSSVCWFFDPFGSFLFSFLLSIEWCCPLFAVFKPVTSIRKTWTSRYVAEVVVFTVGEDNKTQSVPILCFLLLVLFHVTAASVPAVGACEI